MPDTRSRQEKLRAMAERGTPPEREIALAKLALARLAESMPRSLVFALTITAGRAGLRIVER